MSKGKYYIGTSGWSYKHWKDKFYPEDIKQKDWLNYYTKKFDTVELNGSFYHLPKKETFRNWKEVTPDNFIFSVKASRFITHNKKLKDPKEPVRNFYESANRLGKKIGITLFQLPPNLNYNHDKLKHFVKILPKTKRYTIEFRNQTWWNDDAFSILKKNNIAFCIFELGDVQSPKMITADFVYIRLHGPDGKYKGNYNKVLLSKWKKDIQKWNKEGKDVYCYFDNDEKAYAPNNALKLISMLKK